MISLPCCSYSGRRRRSLEVLLQELRNPSTQDEPEADSMTASSGEGDEGWREFVASRQSPPDWFRRPQVSLMHEKCLGNFQLYSSCVKTLFSRLKNSNKMQQYADIYLLLNYYTCFGRPSRPSSGVNKTVVAASGTDHTIWGASFFKRNQIRTPCLVTFEEACTPDSMICTRGCNYSFIHS